MSHALTDIIFSFFRLPINLAIDSPINDILDKEGGYSLEELLQEAELLQEVKSRNSRLLEFLSKPSTIAQMIMYVITPAEDDVDDVRRFKYPYMSSEVFCCEISDILQTFVEHEDGKLLSEFFTFLDVDGVIDSHLAGYFEKVLEMLLRHTTGPVIQFLNDGGIPTFSQFLKHVDNYSIMQLVQRIMLPHIPFSMSTEGETSAPGREEPLCNWAYLEETCELLCIQMIESTNADIPSHISDLFITVLQLSPAEAPILGHICQKACLDRILVASFYDEADTPNLFDAPSVRACVSLAALSVVESILSRLCETAGIPSDELIDKEAIVRLKTSTENLCAGIQGYFETIAQQLDDYATKKPCGELVGQSKESISRLGHRGLQLVKLVESLVRLGDADLDSMLCESNVLKNTLELIFVYEGNSMLHLSIQRIILMVIESDSSRESLQRYVFIETGLLRRIVGEIRKHYPVITASDGEREEALMATSHPPTLGHFLNITQAMNHTLKTLKPGEEEGTADLIENDRGQEEGDLNDEVDPPTSEQGAGTSDEESSTTANDDSDGVSTVQPEDESLPTVAQNSLVTLMEDESIAGEWNLFVEEIMRPLEMRNAMEESDEYSEKDLQAQEAQIDMEYAMQALGIQNQRQEDENPSWMDSDQFHFDEAHDVDEDGSGDTVDVDDDDDEENEDDEENKIALAVVGESTASAFGNNQQENFADFSDMVMPNVNVSSNSDGIPATFEANFDTNFGEFPQESSEQSGDSGTGAITAKDNLEPSTDDTEDVFAKTPDPFQGEGADKFGGEGD